MSYTPNTWQTGDVITAAKLNAMEQGIANAGGTPDAFYVEFEWNDDTENDPSWDFRTVKTAGEILQGSDYGNKSLWNAYWKGFEWNESADGYTLWVHAVYYPSYDSPMLYVDFFESEKTAVDSRFIFLYSGEYNKSYSMEMTENT